jgi:hypothetical protein
LLQTKGIKGREAGQPISGQALSKGVAVVGHALARLFQYLKSLAHGLGFLSVAWISGFRIPIGIYRRKRFSLYRYIVISTTYRFASSFGLRLQKRIQDSPKTSRERRDERASLRFGRGGLGLVRAMDQTA